MIKWFQKLMVQRVRWLAQQDLLIHHNIILITKSRKEIEDIGKKYLILLILSTKKQKKNDYDTKIIDIASKILNTSQRLSQKTDFDNKAPENENKIPDFMKTDFIKRLN